jgi:hypothetical protein
MPCVPDPKAKRRRRAGAGDGGNRVGRDRRLGDVGVPGAVGRFAPTADVERRPAR